MKSQGYGMLLISTQVDEDAQHFYRKMGYRVCGGFVIDIPGYEQPMELKKELKVVMRRIFYMGRSLKSLLLVVFFACLLLMDPKIISASIRTVTSDDGEKITLSGKVEKVRFKKLGIKENAYILKLSKPIYIVDGNKKNRIKIKEVQLAPNSKKVKKLVVKKKVKVKGMLFSPDSLYYIRRFALRVR